MRFVVKAGAGFSVVTVVTDDAQDALARATVFQEQGLEDVVVIADEVQMPLAEFRTFVDEPRAA